MYRYFYSPNILATGTSDIGEESYSHHLDPSIGVPVIDRWTYYALDFFERVTAQSTATMAQFLASFDPNKLGSHPGVRVDLYKRDLRKVPVTDFFGSKRQVELMDSLSPHLLNSSASTTSEEGTVEDDENGKREKRESRHSQSHKARILQASEHLHTLQKTNDGDNRVWKFLGVHPLLGVAVAVLLLLSSLYYSQHCT
jgi:phosphatidylinositol glycan class K